MRRSKVFIQGIRIMTAQLAGQTLVGTGGDNVLTGGQGNDTIWGDGTRRR